MPENARVFIAEDNPQFLEAFGRKLTRYLVEAIGRLAPNVKTVGMSASKIEGVTIDLGKKNYSDLAAVVTSL